MIAIANEKTFSIPKFNFGSVFSWKKMFDLTTKVIIDPNAFGVVV